MCVLVFMAALYLCVNVEAQVKPIFINCGTKSSVTADGRFWVGDSAPNANFTLTSPGEESSTAAESIGDHPLAEIYSTARVFTGGDDALNYTVRGLPEGIYVVRLHFCPVPLANGSSFAVAANGLRLASELDVPGEIAHRNSSVAVVVKEYFIPVRSGTLAVEFSADGESVGFVSAVEILPALDGLLPESAVKVGGSIASLGLPGRGAETMYRLNVGGTGIPAAADAGMWRAWEVDSGYMITANAGSEIRNTSEIIVLNETAAAPPVEVYETARSMSNVQSLEKKFNMSWRLEVHPGFDYLVRLHFCELEYSLPNHRTFRIFLNNRTAADEFDVFSRAGGLNRPLRHDFLDSVASDSSAIWIQLGPGSAAAAVSDAFLNGVEVFKLSRSGGSLAYAKRFEPIRRESSPRHGTLVLWVGLGSGLAFLAILAAAATLVLRLRSGKSNGKPTMWRPLTLHREVTKAAVTATGTVRGGKRFSLAEVRSATKNFDESLVIGVGGFGKVYRGETEDGTATAVKRANPQSEQGLSEFETEIEMLSKLRHRHLVSMIGYCEEGGEMILVYEYMANGTLREHLFGGARPALTWRRRVEACIGAARGLHYLHTGAERGIIHRDVKTTNILLDADFVAKMADFGLSKDGPALDHTHVSTAVKGSFGYLDPEYFRRERLTEKSDVYSFGVVLFEVLCARPVINPTLPKEQINLAEWVMTWQRRGSLQAVVDQRLHGGYAPESVKKFAEIAEKCLSDYGKDRPTMGEVLWHLEYALQLHVAWLASNDKVEEEEGCKSTSS